MVVSKKPWVYMILWNNSLKFYLVFSPCQICPPFFRKFNSEFSISLVRLLFWNNSLCFVWSFPPVIFLSVLEKLLSSPFYFLLSPAPQLGHEKTILRFFPQKFTTEISLCAQCVFPHLHRNCDESDLIKIVMNPWSDGMKKCVQRVCPLLILDPPSSTQEMGILVWPITIFRSLDLMTMTMKMMLMSM